MPRKKTFKAWQVIYANGMHVTTTNAYTEDEARQQAYEALNRPGRYAILSKWVADGKLLRLR